MKAVDPLIEQATQILNSWSWSDQVNLEVINSGLINRSLAVRIGDRCIAVMQLINPSIVPPEVNEDIDIITSWLTLQGITTPRLIRTKEGALFATDHEGEIWRCLTHVGTRTINTFSAPKQAQSAAHLVACFHSALIDLDFKLCSPKQGAQDTGKHLANLYSAITEHRSHRFIDQVTKIRDEIENIWAKWHGPENLPVRIIHGDLKLNNIRFDEDEAVALIDLDTFANSTFDVEIGDALRSWCNTAGEDTTEAVFDLDIFTAAMRGFYDVGCGNFATKTEWESIIPGLERITLNLTARFSADALQECYFGWDEKHGGRGEHNLIRARGQLCLLHKIRAHQAEAEHALHSISHR